MKRVLLISLLAFGQPLAAADLTLMGEFTWNDDQANFGGFSAIEVSPDGVNFTAVSDRGRALTGRITRVNGVITAVSNTPLIALKDKSGAPVRRYDVDSEGLAIAADGRDFISFESNHRVWRYDSLGGAAGSIGTDADFKKFQVNSGMESLAIDTRGWLYTMPERSGAPDRPFPVYRHRETGWDQPFSIPRIGDFLPVGADFGPDGKFYLLERDFVWYSGFRSRIRRFDLTDNGFENQEILLETGFRTHDNLEGIAAWTNPAGQVCLTMVSDDNFNILQTTELVDYCLIDTPK